MRFLALATDYDGTLASQGVVDARTISALERLRATGRKLLLVTGRELHELKEVFARLDLFDSVVAENGALLFSPATGQERPLADPPPELLVKAFHARGVSPLSVGRVIVATLQSQEVGVRVVLASLGLPYHAILNKDSLMVLPTSMNKATGLAIALESLGISPSAVVAIGDAENDHAFLQACGCGVATGNATELLKKAADWVTRGSNGAGVRELIDEVVQTDLAALTEKIDRRVPGS